MPKKYESFQVIPSSPWPIIIAALSFVFAISIIMLFRNYWLGKYFVVISIITLTIIITQWMKDVIRESRSKKYYSTKIQKGLRIGVGIFLLSELVIFLVFIISFFYSASFYTNTLNKMWPPKHIIPVNPWDIPAINTLILVLSGTSLTWANYELNQNNQNESLNGFKYTIILGMIFTILQVYEYYNTNFNLENGVYAVNFYITTGLHGLHVILGIIFLYICYIRIKSQQYNNNSSKLGIEFASWYWNFIDVIWLILFICFYVIS